MRNENNSLIPYFLTNVHSLPSPLLILCSNVLFSHHSVTTAARSLCECNGLVAVHASPRSSVQEPRGGLLFVAEPRGWPHPAELPQQECCGHGPHSRAEREAHLWVLNTHHTWTHTTMVGNTDHNSTLRSVNWHPSNSILKLRLWYKCNFLYILFPLHVDEFKGHSLLQAAREADMAKVKKTLALEIISFKHPQTNETALVSTKWLKIAFRFECKVKPFLKHNTHSSLVKNSVIAKKIAWF